MLKLSFSEIFGATFVVGAAFDGAMTFLGLLAAVLNPKIFHSGPAGAQVAASSPGQAIGVLVTMAVALIFASLVVSAVGAAVVVAVRSVMSLSARSQPRKS